MERPPKKWAKRECVFMSAELQAKIAAYRVPADLTGLRVPDVGAWDDYWTFQALHRGAHEVVAIDDFSDRRDTIQKVPRPKWETFDLCRAALGYSKDRCRRIEVNVYDVTPETLGLFDVVFFFGTLYHLRHSLLALDKLSAVCTSRIFVESAISDDYSPYYGLDEGYAEDMVMEFFPDAQLGQNPTNWWSPTSTCLDSMVRAAGFQSVAYWKLKGEPTAVPHCRGFVRGVKA